MAEMEGNAERRPLGNWRFPQPDFSAASWMTSLMRVGFKPIARGLPAPTPDEPGIPLLSRSSRNCTGSSRHRAFVFEVSRMNQVVSGYESLRFGAMSFASSRMSFASREQRAAKARLISASRSDKMLGGGTGTACPHDWQEQK